MNNSNEQFGQVMASAVLKQMNVWEQHYEDIAELYALNDELIATVEQAADPKAQLALIGALVETIGDSADMLTEEYIALCEGAVANHGTSKSRVESGLRRVYMAIHDFTARTRETRNAALVVVKKIRRQLEQVIAHFVQFMTISLDRVMQKSDIEELNAHHASIALMLHSVNQMK